MRNSITRRTASFYALAVTVACLTVVSSFTGCLSHAGRPSPGGVPPTPTNSVFQRQIGGEPHYFLDDRAREIEKSLGVGGQ